MSVWLWTYVVTKALPSMYTSMTYGVYIFFASCLICASIYAFFFIHETKGLRMDQMDQLFGFVGQGTDYTAAADVKSVGLHREETDVGEVGRLTDAATKV
jgi:Sugar (and other) transporter